MHSLHTNHLATRQRNITPNFLRFKRSPDHPGKATAEEPKGDGTDRSSSRASRASLEAYEKKILHMSKLSPSVHAENFVTQRNREENPRREDDPSLTKKPAFENNYCKLRVVSSEKATESSERENTNVTGHNLLIHRLTEAKKRNSASGKVLIRPGRTPSNPKRTEESLEKEEERARAANAELLQTMMRNQVVGNCMSRLKLRKTEQKKTKVRLNLQVEMKVEEELRKYEIFGELGKGAYGLVRMGVNRRTGEKIAIKIYEKRKIDEPNKVKNLEREINILAELKHSVIARLVEVIETANEIFLILEYGGANSLYNYLLSREEHRLDEAEAKRFLLVIAEALEYLHSKDIVHRDIKAENILINRHKELKLIDFGFSLRCSKRDTIDTFCGTPTYMAPEIVSKVDHCPVYTDMWSLGILFYVMLQGNYPFRAKTERELFDKIKLGRFEYIHADISDAAKQMIESLLRVDPYTRLTIQDVLSPKYRAWLTNE